MSSSSTPARRYKVDPIVQPLQRGERPVTWGLNASAHPLCIENLREPYNHFRKLLETNLQDCGAYVYPYEYLHVTACSPAPFTHTTIKTGDTETSIYEEAFLKGMREECVPGKNDFPSAPFPLIYKKPRLESAAAIFDVEDPTHALPRIRTALSRVAQHPDMVPYTTAAAMRTPGIVHCTFIRFFSSPQDPSITDDEILARFQKLADQWEPVTIMADALWLVKEIHPYMHLNLWSGAEHETCVIGKFPYASLSPNSSSEETNNGK